MSQEGKVILESTLGNLLGFDDGADDVLDHLVTIESKEDLAEYLSQLLGNETPEIVEFVENVGRFQRGEEVILASTEKDGHATDDSKPEALNIEAPESLNQTNNKNKSGARRNQKQSNGRVPPPSKKAMNSGRTKIDSDSEPNATVVKNEIVDASQAPIIQKAAQKVKKSQPTRGKATVVCGCFGTKHKVLTNCLYCGRISCIEEGYDFCPFCGYLIEEIKDEINGNEASWVQKERLLRFDREFARRTQIFDDQADFQAPATWMSEEERIEAEEKQNDRVESLQRQKQTLSLAFD